MKCTRCNGRGLYITHVVNGQGIVAKQNNGVCYRCKGSGTDPNTKKEEINMEKKTDVKVAIIYLATQKKNRVGAVEAVSKLSNSFNIEPKEVMAVMKDMVEAGHIQVKKGMGSKKYYSLTPEGCEWYRELRDTAENKLSGRKVVKMVYAHVYKGVQKKGGSKKLLRKEEVLEDLRAPLGDENVERALSVLSKAGYVSLQKRGAYQYVGLTQKSVEKYEKQKEGSQ